MILAILVALGAGGWFASDAITRKHVKNAPLDTSVTVYHVITIQGIETERLTCATVHPARE